MSFNLLDTVKGFFTPDLISSAAASLGESEGGIQKALSGGIPSLLVGLLGKASSTEGASGILDLARQAGSSGILNNLGGFLGNDNNLIGKGAEMLKGLLGDKAGGVASLISNFAGIKHASASSILSMAAPVALGVTGEHAASNNLSAAGLASFLATQKDSIINALPSGLQTMLGSLGLGAAGSTIGTAAVHTTGNAHTSIHQAEEETGGSLKFLVPLFLGILAVALGIYLFKGCTGKVKESGAIADTTAAVTEKSTVAEAPAAGNTRELFKVKLPNDTLLEAYKGGIEDKLVAFLGTDYKKLGEDSLKKVWFDFDNLNFKTGSAVITDDSQTQVNNLAAILKAFPAVKLKIGGYTDKVGDEAVNKKLSDARAKAVQAALGKAGVGAQIVSAEGYGSSFAVYQKDAPESDRVKDRHVSVSVR